MKKKAVQIVIIGFITVCLIIGSIYLSSKKAEALRGENSFYGHKYIGTVISHDERIGEFTMETSIGRTITFSFCELTKWGLVCDFKIGDEVQVQTIYKRGSERYYDVLTVSFLQ